WSPDSPIMDFRTLIDSKMGQGYGSGSEGSSGGQGEGQVTAVPLRRQEPPPVRVLLLAPERLGGRSYLRALHRATVDAECVGTVAELEARAREGDTPVPVLVMVLSPARGALGPRALAGLASRLSANARTRPPEQPTRGAQLADSFR